MSTPRLFVDSPLAEGVEIQGTPAQAHHLGTVLRRGVGDAVVLFNARDGEFAASILHLRKDRCAFAVGPLLRAAVPEPGLRLVMAALKRDATLPLQVIAREHIIKTLDEVHGNKAVAARLLGISRRAFYRQLERHGLHQRTPTGSRLPLSSEDTLEQAS